jgi:hypothetical protein
VTSVWDRFFHFSAPARLLASIHVAVRSHQSSYSIVVTEVTLAVIFSNPGHNLAASELKLRSSDTARG